MPILKISGTSILGRAVLFTLGLGWACQPSTAPEQPAGALTTLILVRHAEKADDGTDDPPLTEKGSRRAETLAEWLSYTDLAAIYSTPYRRNQATVAPVAREHNLSVETYDAGGDIPAFLKEIMDQQAGETVLISGHSNTVPSMLNTLLGEDQYANLADSEYDHIFIATGDRLGEVSIVDLRMEVEETASQ